MSGSKTGTQTKPTNNPKEEIQMPGGADIVDKQFPRELLLQIFGLLCVQNVQIKDLTQPPWVFGQVCSYWRCVSRGDAQLWGILRIELAHTPTVDIGRAVDILPPYVKLDLDWNFIPREKPVEAHLVHPYLNRCQTLSFTGRIQLFDDILYGIPENAFINLQRLCMKIDYVGGRRKYGDWTSASKALRLATQLRHLSIMCLHKDCSRDLLSLEFSWERLDKVTLVVPWSIPDLCRLLKQCHAIIDLSVGLGQRHAHSVRTNDQLFFPKLQNLRILELGGFVWFDTLQVWNHLSRLILPHAIYYHSMCVHDVLERCINLQYLSLTLPNNFPCKPLLMPNLTSMHMMGDIHRSRLAYLTCPNLTSLEVVVDESPEISMSSQLAAMLEKSTSLTHLFYRTHQSDYPAFLVRDILLSISSTATDVRIMNSPVQDAILHDIGLGRLLPKFRVFKFVPDSVDAVVDMLDLLSVQASHRSDGEIACTVYSEVYNLVQMHTSNKPWERPDKIKVMINLKESHRWRDHWRISRETK